MELLAAATLFDKPVYYFEAKSQKWGVWQPSESADHTTELNPISHLELEYHQNQHYNSIVDITTSLPCVDVPDIPTTHVYIHDMLS